MSTVGELPHCGRRRITDHLIPQCLERPRDLDRELPVVLLMGGHGSGKTKLLRDVRESCTASSALPFAWIDLHRSGYTRSWQVAADLAATLGSTRWREFGTLKFPRFTLGAMTIQQYQLDLSDPAQARAGVAALLNEHGALDRSARALADLLRQLAGSGIPVPGLGAGLALGGGLLSGAAGSRKATQLLFRTGMTWYGNRGQGPAGDGFGALVDLNRLERAGGATGARDVDTLLCEALLADLRACYRGAPDSCNSLAILDNADHPAGEAFLKSLAAARAQVFPAQGGSDPLLVVAARRTWYSPGAAWSEPWSAAADGEPGQEAEAERRVRGPDDAGYEDWTRTRPAPPSPGSWWYPVALGDLSGEEVLEQAQATRPRELARLAVFVRRLTSGHAGGAAQVLRMLAEQPSTPTELELRHLLELPWRAEAGEAADAGGNVGDVLLQRLLAGLPAWERDLVTWSASPDVAAPLAAGLGQSRTGSGEALRAELARTLLLTEGEGEGAGPALHPWPRRLLLRQLAARPLEDAWNWDRVNARLRAHHEAHGESVRACYHALALGRLEPAVDLLHDCFPQVGADEWIKRFNGITSAPNRLEGTAPPEVLVDGLLAHEPPATADGGSRHDTILHMVAARWILSDPLRDPDRRLNAPVANGYAFLANSARRGALRFLREKEEYP